MVDRGLSSVSNFDMANNKGLGKGLGALISLFDDEEGAPSNSDKALYAQNPGEKPAKGPVGDGVAQVRIDLIDNNADQPRKNFNPEELKELEQSIAANGVLQPILLHRVGKRYMIVAGERRWRASKNLGLETIPALIREYTPKQIAEIALVENLMRSNLNEMEIALGVKRLMDGYDMTQDQVSRVLGMSRAAISNSVRFLNLPKSVQEMLEDKTITAGHAKILCGVPDYQRLIELSKMCAKGMSVRSLEIEANKPIGLPKEMLHVEQFGPMKEQTLELRKYAFCMEKHMGTRVYISGNEDKGKIVIEYNSTAELERLFQMLPH